MNMKLVLFLLGRIGIVFGASLFFPLVVSIALNEDRFAEFSIPILISVVIGIIFTRGDNPYHGRLSLREGLAVIGFGSLLVCFLGSFPYIIAGYDVVSALFESIAGFTTTGASNLVDLETSHLSLILWRSLTQWIGGLAIILIFITLVPQVGSGASQLFTAELHGESAERLMPRITATTHMLIGFYLGLTGLLAGLLFLGGMNGFEATTHAMATTSTGGFSMYKTGLMHFANRPLEMILLLFMFIAGGNYVLYYRAYKNGWRTFWRDTEFKAYLAVIAFFSVVIALDLSKYNIYGGLDCGYYGLFQTVSFVTTTGFVAQNYNEWPDFSRYCLLLLMFVGGCTGSTAGGIKIARLVILFKLTWAELKRTIHPQMVTDIRMTGETVRPAMIAGISRFFFLYMFIFVFVTMTLSLVSNLGMFESIGIAAACLGNVGPAFDIVSPISSYAQLNVAGKLVSCMAMLLGRVEIITLLVFLHPDFWRSNKNW
ncbi:MAG: TrkH family potassium uptake protein [Acidaminococcaceae bacterium]